MTIDIFCKSASEILDYVFDFRRELEPGEKIVDARAVANRLAVMRVTYSDTKAAVWLAGGAEGQKYIVRMTVDTSGGRRHVNSFVLQVHGGRFELARISISDASVKVGAFKRSAVSIADASVKVGFLDDEQPHNRLRTRGAAITRRTGEVVRLQAINWFGFESSNRVPHGLWAAGYKELIDKIVAMGFNAIRFPFAGNTFTGTPTGVDFSKPGNTAFQVPGTGTVKPAFDVLDTLIAYAQERGLWIILDHHRRTIGTGSDGAPTGTGYTQAQWIATWRMLAQRYGQNPTIIGADLHNEPHQLTWAAWADLAEACGNAIHEIAPDWLIFVEGVGKHNGQSYWQGGQLAGVRDRPVLLSIANRVVYSPHDYGQSVAQQPWLKSATNPNVANWPTNLPAIFSNAWGFIAEESIAPIWVGEFGGKFGLNGTGVVNQPNAEVERQWLAQLAEYMNLHGVSFAYWCLNPNSGDTGGLLRDDWKTLQTPKLELLQPLFGTKS